MIIEVQQLDEHGRGTFVKAHADDVGYDLTCVGWEIKDGVYRLKLGVAVKPPDGYWFMLVPRSSFAKTGWTQANNVGIIDPGYRGEWAMNVSPLGYIEAWSPDTLIGMRVAQAVLMIFPWKLMHMQGQTADTVRFVLNLDKTKRGTGGFGSTDYLEVKTNGKEEVVYN
jgi:dUTPase